MKNRPLLSISMLVSGKSKDMWKSIDSLICIQERISTEIILIDTGCTKEVHSRLEKKADKLLSFTWCDDFAKARNTGLEVATGEWFMYLDDDEWFEDLEGLVEFFQSGMYREYGYACYKVRNYIDPEGTQYSDSWVERLARRTESLTFQSKIHEFLTGKEGEKYYLPLVAEHYGYAFASEEEKIAHFNRNEKLLLEMKKEEPHNLRWDMQLVQEYRVVARYQDMIRIGNEKYEPALRNNLVSLAEVFILSSAIGSLEERRYRDALDIVTIIEQEDKLSKMTKAYGYSVGTKAAFYTKEYAKSEEYANKYIEAVDFFETNVKERQKQEGLPFVSETFDDVKKKEVYSIKICDGLRRGDVNPLGEYMEKLGWNSRHVYVFEDMASELIRGMVNIGYTPEFYKVGKLIWRQQALRNYFLTVINDSVYSGEEKESVIRFFNKVEEACQIIEELKKMERNGMKEQVRLILSDICRLLPEDDEIRRFADRI